MELKSPTIERLPNELIVGVLNELDFRDLLKCRGVSQSFKNLIDHSPHLKYKIELAVAGMIDAGGNNISIKERRTRLMKYQSNWTDLQWQQVENLPLSGGNVWELFGNVMAVKTRSGGLSFKRLAGHSRSVAAKSWDLENLGVEFMTFALDPSQDLLVLVETTRQGLGGLPTISGTQPFRIHLRSMSTGEDHPSSLDSIYHLAQLYVINGDWRFGVQFLGDNLGISFESANSSTTEICVWNWKTGHLLKCIKPHFDVVPVSFVLLTNSHILVALVAETQGKLVVYQLTEAPSTIWVRLSLPQIEFHYPHLPLTSYRDLAIMSSSSSGSEDDECTGAPFHIANDSRIVAITIRTVQNNEDHCTWIHIVPLSILINHLERQDRPPSSFEWEAWASKETCLLSGPTFNSRPCLTSGTRCITPIECVEEPLDKVEFEVYDFNQFAFRHGSLARRNHDLAYFSTVTVRTGQGYDTIVTELPYRRKKVTLPSHLTGLLHHVNLSEDSLILVESHLGNPKSTVLTF